MITVVIDLHATPCLLGIVVGTDHAALFGGSIGVPPVAHDKVSEELITGKPDLLADFRCHSTQHVIHPADLFLVHGILQISG
jgi:hypothetical protein